MIASSLTETPRFPQRSSDSGTVEHCQTHIMEDNYQQHQQQQSRKKPNSFNSLLNNTGSSNSLNRSLRRNNSVSSENAFSPSVHTPLLSSVPTTLEYYDQDQFQTSPRSTNSNNTIRFQVVVWYIGKIDMIQGRVPATFRITIFWNDTTTMDAIHNNNDDAAAGLNDDMSQQTSMSQPIWQMHGRQMAIQQQVKGDDGTTPLHTVQVPAVSILNVVTFDTIGSPEVSLLREDTKLMRWTCMYRATLIQDHWRVDKFPHDEHDLTLKLAILANRRQGEPWDRHVWNLALATADDSKGSTRIPYGLVVNQVAIPEFNYNQKEGLIFRFVPLEHGQGCGGGVASKDKCLEISLKVFRDSSYYDKNIMPLLGLLNFVAMSITVLEAADFFQRGLLTLNIAFVEIGIRMTTDKHLPSVSYQIKMQRIMNEYFYGLLFLVLESLFVYVLAVRWNIPWTGYVDLLAACTALIHNVHTQVSYFNDAKRMKQKVLKVASPKLPKTSSMEEHL